LEYTAEIKKLVHVIFHGKTSMQINNSKSLYMSLTCTKQNIGTLESYLAILKLELKWILSLLNKSYVMLELMVFSSEINRWRKIKAKMHSLDHHGIWYEV